MIQDGYQSAIFVVFSQELCTLTLQLRPAGPCPLPLPQLPTPCPPPPYPQSVYTYIICLTYICTPALVYQILFGGHLCLRSPYLQISTQLRPDRVKALYAPWRWIIYKLIYSIVIDVQLYRFSFPPTDIHPSSLSAISTGPFTLSFSRARARMHTTL